LIYGTWILPTEGGPVTVLISKERFRLDNSYDNGYQEITISGWEPLTNTSPDFKDDFPSGLKLTGKVDTNMEYSDVDTLSLFLSKNGATLMQLSGDDDFPVYYAKDGTDIAEAGKAYSYEEVPYVSKLDGLIENGRILITEGRYDDAITELTKALKIDSNSVLALLYRGTAYGVRGGKGDVNLGLKDLRKAKKIDPTNFMVQFQIENLENLQK
jgi:tetratricopeptide (TPR) repeat protein